MENKKISALHVPLRVSLQKFVAGIYFFLNSVGLPKGLLFTNLLTPFFLLWLARHRQLKKIMYIFLAMVPFALIHYYFGVEVKSFIVSNFLFLSTWIFVLAAWYYCKAYSSLREVMNKLLVLNFILVLIAIPFYFMPEMLKDIFWYTNKFTTQIKVARLAMFTYEASYYSMLLIPLCYYYWFKLIFRHQVSQRFTVLLMSVLPLLLSMSFGVIGATVLTGMIMIWLNRRALFGDRKFSTLVYAGFVVLTFSFLFIALVFPDNILVVRIRNIFLGYDTSTNGRTFEAFEIAWKVAQKKSVVFGCGLGQVKHIIPDIITTYFSHWGKQAVYYIPNTVAETMAIFGVSGLIIRFIIIFYLFFKTRVLSNHYRTALFIFVFIYQFTGSYITNIVEYVIWTLAFVNCFPEFDKIKFKKAG